jgi:hypothetical protein
MRATGTPLVLALSLLVPRIRADDEHRAVTTDDLALLADRLDRRSDLHESRPLRKKRRWIQETIRATNDA